MAGLLDFLSTPDAQMGLGLLAAGGARSDGAGFGQRIQEAMQYVDKQRQMKAAEDEQRQKMQYQAALIQEHQQKVQMQRSAMEQAALKQAAIPGLFRGGQQALSPLAGDPDSGILPSAGRPAVPASLDVQAALRAGLSPDEITKLAGLSDIGRPEVARVVNGMEGGREVAVQYDKFGNRVGSGSEQYRAPITLSTGDRQQLLDPYTLLPQATFPMGQSPDSKASNALGWSNNALANRRFEHEKAQGDKPTWIESLGGFVNPRTQQVMPARDSQGNPVVGAGPKMSEDQAKASGWLAQANNAFGNMQGAMRRDPSAAEPGVLDALAAIPSFGMAAGAANIMRGSDRQEFMQGVSSLSEALLRAATGAGVNAQEAQQKINELTPVIGDSKEVRAQKLAAIPVFLKALEMRAGPGAKQVNSFVQPGNTNQDDPLGLFTR